MKKSLGKTVIIFYKNKRYEYYIDFHKNLNNLVEEITNFLKVPNKKFISLSYKNYTLDPSLQGNFTLKKIFTKDRNPSITIMTSFPKNSRNIETLEYSNSKKTIKSNHHSLTKNINRTIENNSNKLNSNYNLYIYNIPSFIEMSQLLDDFYKNNSQFQESNFPKAVITALEKNNNNNVCISFPNEVIKNNFHNYLSYIKYENPKFKNIIIKLKKNNKNLSLSLANDSKKIPNNNYKMNIATKILKLKNSHNKHLIKKNLSDYNFNDINNELYKQVTKTDCDKIIIDYYRHQNSLRNSSPYIDEEEKRLLDEKENKKKFISDKGFFTAVGKYSMPPHYISNYVQLSPSENPSTHKFRNVNKNKWITNKGFI